MSKPESADSRKPRFIDIVKSTLAAAAGVQSNKNRERDFAHGNILAYVVSGLIFTVLFIMTVVMVVNMVIGASSK